MIENVKGTRDFAPQEKILRDSIITKLKAVFEQYGFNPLETPILEKWELLTSKGGAGEGSDTFNEMYKLKDQGNRELGLRFELTLSLARFMAMNPKQKMPFKRYEIGNVYRDGPVKLGRYREFTQCDVDTVGVKGMGADAECLLLAEEVFKALNLDVVLEVNNRKVMFGLLANAGVPEEKKMAVLIAVDKLKKIGETDVVKELETLGINDDTIAKLMSAFNVKGSNEEKISLLQGLITEEGKEGLKEIETVLALAPNVRFEPSLARGLGYYTGTVFEGFMKDGTITSSLCGGGRFDKMIGSLSNKEIPAVGISFGLEPIIEVIKKNSEETKKSVVKVFIIPIKNFAKALPVAQKLREANIPTDIDLMERNVSKNLDFANSNKIPYVIIAGPDELEQNNVKVKNMQSGEETTIGIDDLILFFNDKN